MPNETVLRNNNFDRLLKHLKADSLAARIVRARGDPDAPDPAGAMKEVLRDRLAQLRKRFENPED
jgi:hypothetical protein